jgi:hypothetical protein
VQKVVTSVSGNNEGHWYVLCIVGSHVTAEATAAGTSGSNFVQRKKTNSIIIIVIDGNVFIVQSAVEFLWGNRAVLLKSFRRILGTGYSAINELRRLPASRQLSKNGLPIRWKNHSSQLVNVKVSGT